MRDYGMMRAVLLVVAEGAAAPNDFADLGEWASVAAELDRLRDDGLLRHDLKTDRSGVCFGGEVQGLTGEGRAFLRLVENPQAWSIMRTALDAAGIDVSYPLLKEVCEEVVKRYVMRFIPD